MSSAGGPQKRSIKRRDNGMEKAYVVELKDGIKVFYKNNGQP